MTEFAHPQVIHFTLVFTLLVTSYIPVNLKVGGPIDSLLSTYFATFMFRGFTTVVSCFSGYYNAVLVAIVMAVVVEVSILVHMSMAHKESEVLA
jgi:hypothetical protein